jgi:hypothetical protein
MRTLIAFLLSAQALLAINVTNYPVITSFGSSNLFLVSSIADRTNYNVPGNLVQPALGFNAATQGVPVLLATNAITATNLPSGSPISSITNGLLGSATAAAEYDPIGSAQNATNGYPWGVLYDAAGVAQQKTNGFPWMTATLITNPIAGMTLPVNVSGSAATVTSVSGNSLTSGQVTTGIGYTPATNSAAGIVSALGYTPLGAASNAVSATAATTATNLPSGSAITTLTNGLQGALGYTPLTNTESAVTNTFAGHTLPANIAGNAASSTTASTASAGWPTTWTLNSATFANQGSVFTLLHGNASGNPAWSAVDLAHDVTGSLPYGSIGSPPWISANQTITLSGDDTGSGTTAITTTVTNIQAAYLKTPTNTPVDTYVLTATGTGGGTAWNVASGGGGASLSIATNAWAVNTSLIVGSGTNWIVASGAATIGVTGVSGVASATGSIGELTVYTTGTVIFTNPASFRLGDFVNSRTIPSGYMAEIAIKVIPGVSTNILVTLSK